MLNILIYSDNTKVSQFVKAVIDKLIGKIKCNTRVETPRQPINPETFYAKVEKDPFFYDICLLDCTSEKTYEIAEVIRRNNLKSSIVFLVDENTQVVNLLKYRPSGAIFDAFQVRDIFNGVKTAFLEQQLHGTTGFLIKTKEKLYKLPYNTIDYFENTQRIVTVFSNDCLDKVSFYATFEKIYESLPKNIFVKCHQSLIVNVTSIKFIDRTNRVIVLNSGKEIEISKRHYADTIDFFERFCLFK